LRIIFLDYVMKDLVACLQSVRGGAHERRTDSIQLRSGPSCLIRPRYVLVSVRRLLLARLGLVARRGGAAGLPPGSAPPGGRGIGAIARLFAKRRAVM